jgi:threonine aldolase
MVDLRSDTVTRPTPAMRQAMADAEVGDDWYGEDPTVRRLEEAFAARVGKAAALFVPSGTMGNQIALRLLGSPGQFVVAGRRHHVVMSESGAAGVNGAYQLLPVDDPDGVIDVEAVEELAAGGYGPTPAVAAVALENTHMASGGRVSPLSLIEKVAALAPAVHLDGARLFNAEAASGVAASAYAAPATTVMCCMSKGLAAPVGSLLAGSQDVMAAARVERARLGGGMRQVGVIAAAALVALETMTARLGEDHARARRLAEAVADRWPDAPDPAACDTNIVVFAPADRERLLAHLREHGVLGGRLGPGSVRLVTHVDVDDEAIDRACAALAAAP